MKRVLKLPRRSPNIVGGALSVPPAPAPVAVANGSSAGGAGGGGVGGGVGGVGGCHRTSRAAVGSPAVAGGRPGVRAASAVARAHLQFTIHLRVDCVLRGNG